jgi:hypothetical protein
MPEKTDAERMLKRSAESSHDDLVQELCEPLGYELVCAVPKLSDSMAKMRAIAYSRSLAAILRHVPVKRSARGVDEIWKASCAAITQAFYGRWVAQGIDDLPAPLDLVISADCALWFPGGVEIRDAFKVTFFSHGARVEDYEFVLGTWDGYWNASMTRIAFDVLCETPDDRLTADQRSYLTFLRSKKPRSLRSGVWTDGGTNEPAETNVSRIRLLWIKKGHHDEWDAYVRWIHECRLAVMMPKALRQKGW